MIRLQTHMRTHHMTHLVIAAAHLQALVDKKGVNFSRSQSSSQVS